MEMSLQTEALTAEPSVIIDVAQGKLEGTFDGVARDGRPFYKFLGIQFAEIPGRFELAVPPPNWEGVKSAKVFGPTCDENPENCLYLNVYTPKLQTKEGPLLPVVVYIHGGSFQSNSNQHFGPDYFMDTDVIFIVLQYRLGVFGFLSTGDENAPGNNGLKDQVMALKWIQQNIKAFGGNKDKVTIMGQSAGSASVTYHLVSKMSTAQSGTFLDPWSFTRNPRPYAEKLAELLNCPRSTTKELVNSLKTVPAEEIAKVKRKVTVKWHVEPIAAFGPVIEPSTGNPNETFLSQSPYEMLVNGDISKVPLLTGVVQEEGIYLWAAYILYLKNPITIQCAKDLQTKWTEVAPAAFYFDEVLSSELREKVSLQIRDFYFGKEQVDKKTFYNLAHLYSDRLFVNSAIKFINLYAKHATVYPYLYTFNKHVGIEYGLGEVPVDHPIEATHAAELDMLISPLFDVVRNEKDHNELSKSMVKLWVSFINSGMPTETFGSARSFPSVDPEVGLQKWYRLDTDTQIMDNIFAERKAFWDSLPLKDNDFTSNADK